MADTETWLIRIGGQGTFEFHGTEAEARDMAENTAIAANAIGITWRKSLANESDQITAEIAALWDAGLGVSSATVDARRAARLKETVDG